MANLKQKLARAQKRHEQIEKIRLIIALALLAILAWAIPVLFVNDLLTGKNVIEYSNPHPVLATAEAAVSANHLGREEDAGTISDAEAPKFPLSQELNNHSQGESPASTPADIAVIRGAANAHGIDWKILYAIYQKESQGDCTRIGDKHLKTASYGCFQINLGYHPDITPKQASDLKFSADWTARRLKKNEWRGEEEMIRSHNGLVSDHRNDWYVDDVYKIMASL